MPPAFSALVAGAGRRIWIAYGAICLSILSAIALLGARDKDQLGVLLTEGGVIDQAPALVCLAAAVCALIAAGWRAARADALAVAGISLFVAGEEISWGTERLLGWPLLGENRTHGWDLHDWISHAIVLHSRQWQGALLLLAVAAALLLAVWFHADRIAARFPVVRDPLFILGAIVILAGSNLDTLQDVAGLPYLPGQWPLEEASELCGAIAFLFVSIQLCARSLRARANRQLE